MDNIWNEVRNPAWWFSVVVAGLLINLAASYLKPWTDSFLAQRSEHFRKRSEARSTEKRRRVMDMALEDRELQWAYFAELRYRLIAVLCFITGFGIILVSRSDVGGVGTIMPLVVRQVFDWVALLAWALLMALALKAYKRAVYTHEEISDALLQKQVIAHMPLEGPPDEPSSN